MLRIWATRGRASLWPPSPFPALGFAAAVPSTLPAWVRTWECSFPSWSPGPHPVQLQPTGRGPGSTSGMRTDWPVPFARTAHRSCPSGRFRLRFRLRLGPVTLPSPRPRSQLLCSPGRLGPQSFLPPSGAGSGCSERSCQERGWEITGLTSASRLIKATPFLWVF